MKEAPPIIMIQISATIIYCLVVRLIRTLIFIEHLEYIIE